MNNSIFAITHITYTDSTVICEAKAGRAPSATVSERLGSTLYAAACFHYSQAIAAIADSNRR
jgi:hypothetical protein